jgi:hypothetical protein
MRFLPSRSYRVCSLGLLVVATVLGGASCENKHIGRPCLLSVDPDAGPTGGATATIDVGLECPSRICMLPAQDPNAFQSAPRTTALCTADCSSDDDCADGELRSNDMSGADTRCRTGFACKVSETVGDFCCRRLCVCKDFIGKTPAGGYPTPEVCMSTPSNKVNCKNIQ